LPVTARKIRPERTSKKKSKSVVFVTKHYPQCIVKKEHGFEGTPKREIDKEGRESPPP
jgi:hypothetical protein